MVYEIEFWKRSRYDGCHPFVKNIKTGNKAKVEFSDLVAVGSPVKYSRLSRDDHSNKSLDIIVHGMPEEANAFHRIQFFPINDSYNETVIQYYQVKERLHTRSNLP